MLPATTTVERLCADTLVDAERRNEERIASRLDAATRTALDGLLSETMANGTTRFVWLRQFEPGSNSAAASRLLDRLEFLQRSTNGTSTAPSESVSSGLRRADRPTTVTRWGGC